MIDRYTRDELKQLWSDETKFSNMLRVEIAVVEALHLEGIVPLEDLQKIKQNAKFSIPRIQQLELETHHDVIAFTRSVSESLGSESKWIHYGLTSTDVVDTSQALTLQKVNQGLKQQLVAFMQVLKKQAHQYQKTPCIGRTHGVHAEITSFGLKWALWFDEMSRHLKRFNEVSEDLRVGKLSGAVGNYANTSIRMETKALELLGLKSINIATQVLPRDLHVAYIQTLAGIATTIEKIAIEIRHLARTEVREVQEYFAPGQKGSSAMPHKHNPIASENMCGLARVVRSYISVAHENNLLWHERDISHSSSERIILADATTLVDTMLTRYAKVLATLLVYPERMIENIQLTQGIIFSGRVVSALIQKGWSREQSYDVVQQWTEKAWNSQQPLQKLLKESDVINTLSNVEIDRCFTITPYLAHVDEIYNRIDWGVVNA